MKTRGSIRSLAAAVVAISLTASSMASAAPAAISPLVALSAFGTAQSRASVCAAGAAAVAAAGTAVAAQGQPGCVLPVMDAAPPPLVSEAPPMAPMAPAAPYVVAAAAPNLLPLLAGLALFAGAFFLLDDEILGKGRGNGIQIDVSPI